MTPDFRDSLQPEDRAALQEISRPLNFEPGESVFGEGDRYRGFFLVERGACKVFRVNSSGKQAVLSFFTAGHCIAVLPLFRNIESYPAACSSIQHSDLRLYPVDSMRILLRDRPLLQGALQDSMLEIARFFRDKSSMLMLQSAEERVLGFLQELGAGDSPILLDIPKGQVALYLGITPEAFSRALASLKDRGALSEENGRLRIGQL
ncbi:MAG: Crp/Fnr family transcriptional regulator [Leptospirales bacterium]|nr:Crp/Fnr family transcriptional regulator [Leptospirales bacterium]